MSAEFIIFFIITGIVALIMISIGVSQIKSKKPAGFYTGQEPPKEEQLTDVKQWNKKHGKMWMTYGIAMMCTAFVGPVALAGVVTGGPLLMIWYHSRLVKKYLK